MANISASSRQTRISIIVFALGVGATVLAVSAALYPSLSPGLLRTRQWTMIASTMFVLLGIGARYKVPTRRGSVLLLGLVFCWLGDYLGAIDFTLGALSFLLAHVFFAVAFTANGVDRKRVYAAIGVLLAATFLIAWWLSPQLQSRDIPLVAGYVLAISTMFATALAGRVYPWPYATLAAATFYISDIAVARWRYVDHDARNAFICYPLYYGACVMLALMPLLGKPPRKDTAPMKNGATME